MTADKTDISGHVRFCPRTDGQIHIHLSVRPAPEAISLADSEQSRSGTFRQHYAHAREGVFGTLRAGGRARGDQPTRNSILRLTGGRWAFSTPTHASGAIESVRPSNRILESLAQPPTESTTASRFGDTVRIAI